MSKAIIWCRVSTTEQEFESQKKELIQRAKEDGFVDDDLIVIGKAGASAIKMNELYQKEVDELIDNINSKQGVSTIYVWEVSRLARNEVAFYQMKDIIVKNKIQFICFVPSLVLLDPDGEVNTGSEITLNLLVTLAKQEMEIKKKRFARGKKKLAEEGKYNGGQIPYGYRVEPETKKIVIDEFEAGIVREIFDMYESGFSQKSIAVELHTRGVMGKSARKVKKFTISLVHQILTNEFLTGKKHLNKGSSYERQYPPIITEEQFERCRKIAQNNNTVLPKSRRIYYATGLIKCTECGRYFGSSGKKSNYHCRDAYNNYKKYDGYEGVPLCQNHINISNNVMDSLLWSLTIEYETMFIMDNADKQLEECRKQKAIFIEKLNNIPTLLNSVNEKEERLHEAYVNGMSKQRYNSIKEDIKQQRKEILLNQTNYKNQIQRIEAQQDDISKRMSIINFDGTEDDETLDIKVGEMIERSDRIKSRIAEITDDKERYRLIHKHIKEVTVERDSINYVFKKYPNGKVVPAKKIKVYAYHLKNPEVFCFIPNNGKGGIMLWERTHIEELKTLPIPLVRDSTPPKYIPYDMQYLQRVVDEHKINKRKAIREEKNKLMQQKIANLERKGYISMQEMMRISGRTQTTIYHQIYKKKMNGVKVGHEWYVPRLEFKDYLKRIGLEDRYLLVFLKQQS